MSTFRLGVIGPGLIWERAHRPQIESLSGVFEPVAFSGRSDTTEAKVRRDYPEARFYRDYRELIADPEVDGVVILTPIPLNAPLAMEVLRAGKVALMEKPIGVSVEEARRLCEVEAETDGRIYVLEQAPYNPVWETMDRVIRDGRIGRVAGYETARHVLLDAGTAPERGYGDTDWRIHPEYPLGVLFDGGVHELATHARLFGAPRRVQAVGRSYRESYGDYDHVSMILEYEDGILGTFCHSGYLDGDRNFFVLRGTEGLIYYSDDEFVLERKDGEREELPRPELSAHAAMWRQIAERIGEGRPADYSARDGLREIETLEAVQKSVDEGLRLTVERL